MNLKKRVYPIAVILFALILSFSVVGCSFATSDKDTDDDAPVFSGDNSDYVESTDYEESWQGTDFSALYESTASSAVTVTVSLPNGTTQTGSGFIVDSSNGYAVTSSSLFMDEEEKAILRDCTVELQDGTDLTAQLAGYDSVSIRGENSYFDFSRSLFGVPETANSDIAIIRFDNVENGLYIGGGQSVRIPSEVVFKDSDTLAYGEDCYTIATLAHEEDIIPGLLNEGIITKPFNTHASSFYYYELSPSGKEGEEIPFFDGSFDYLIQMGVPINAGNEGAPLFNAKGELIGVMNMRVNDTYVYAENGPFGIAFATPSETLYQVLQEAGISVSYEQETAARESCIVNESEVLAHESDDSVAQMLMEESPDYFFVDESARIVFRAEGNPVTEGSTPLRTAANNLDRTVKVISYAQIGQEQLLAEGSGFLIDESGYVMTNLHVINALAEQNQEDSGLANTSVRLSDEVYCLFEQGTASGRFVVMPMEIVAYHKKGDLAVLKFKNSILHEDGTGQQIEGFESACVLEETVPSAGESVAALGNALGYGVSVSSGVVSIPAFTSYYSIYGYNMIQTDCPINSGNSGGALFDSKGKIVGINTLGYGGEGVDNVSWAIPAGFAIDFIESVNQGKTSGNVFITEAGAGAHITLAA